jgi:hypothetical protein
VPGQTAIAFVNPGKNIPQDVVGTEANWVWNGQSWGRLTDDIEVSPIVSPWESFTNSWNKAWDEDFMGDENGLWNDNPSIPSQEGFRTDYEDGDRNLDGFIPIDPGGFQGKNNGKISTETDYTSMPGGGAKPGPSAGSSGWGKDLSQGAEAFKEAFPKLFEFLMGDKIKPDSGIYFDDGIGSDSFGTPGHRVGPRTDQGGINPFKSRPATKKDSLENGIE